MHVLAIWIARCYCIDIAFALHESPADRGRFMVILCNANISITIQRYVDMARLKIEVKSFEKQIL